MARIGPLDAKAWAEPTKLLITELDGDLVSQIEEEVILRIAVAYDVSGWTNESNTPKIVKVAIAKLYVAVLWERQYSENIVEGAPDYATRLRANAEMIITGLMDGTIEIPGLDTTSGQPSFYPTDTSSAMEPTFEDPSLGPARFSMGMPF